MRNSKPLTDVYIRNLQAPADVGKHFDSQGLHLLVTRTGSKLWRLKYRFARLEKTLSLGAYPAVSLTEARDSRFEAKKLLARGVDPSGQKIAQKRQLQADALNSFGACLSTLLSQKKDKLTEGTLASHRAMFQNDVLPILGRMPVSAITTADILNVLRKVEARGATDQAHRLLARLKAFFRWACVNQLVINDPCAALKASEVLRAHVLKHRASLPSDDLPSFMDKLDSYKGDSVTKWAILFLMHLALRPGEVRNLRWSDIDFERKILRIPADRMKMRREHRAPLTAQAIDILEMVRPINGHRLLVFASTRSPGNPISENTLNNACKRLGYTITSHGMRSLFSRVANESGLWHPDAIEAALAHEKKDKVRAAYLDSDHFQQRIPLMKWWSDFLCSSSSTKRVLQSLKNSTSIEASC